VFLEVFLTAEKKFFGRKLGKHRYTTFSKVAIT